MYHDQMHNKHTKLSLQQEVYHFHYYQGTSRSPPAKTLLFFKWRLFHSKLSHFSLSEHTPKFTRLGKYITPAKKFHNLLSSWISTTRWRFNQGKCVLAYNSHILCRTLKNLISMCSLNCVESGGIGHAHFPLQICEMSQTYFFKLLPDEVEVNMITFWPKTTQ